MRTGRQLDWFSADGTFLSSSIRASSLTGRRARSTVSTAVFVHQERLLVHPFVTVGDDEVGVRAFPAFSRSADEFVVADADFEFELDEDAGEAPRLADLVHEFRSRKQPHPELVVPARDLLRGVEWRSVGIGRARTRQRSSSPRPRPRG